MIVGGSFAMGGQFFDILDNLKENYYSNGSDIWLWMLYCVILCLVEAGLHQRLREGLVEHRV